MASTSTNLSVNSVNNEINDDVKGKGLDNNST